MKKFTLHIQYTSTIDEHITLTIQNAYIS